MNKKLVALTAAAYLGTFIADIDITIVNVALPAIQADVDASLAELQWIVNSYAVCLAAFMLSASGLSNKFGLKRIWMLAMACLPHLRFFALLQAISACFLSAGAFRVLPGPSSSPGPCQSFFTHLMMPNYGQRL